MFRYFFDKSSGGPPCSERKNYSFWTTEISLHKWNFASFCLWSQLDRCTVRLPWWTSFVVVRCSRFSSDKWKPMASVMSSFVCVRCTTRSLSHHNYDYRPIFPGVHVLVSQWPCGVYHQWSHTVSIVDHIAYLISSSRLLHSTVIRPSRTPRSRLLWIYIPPSWWCNRADHAVREIGKKIGKVRLKFRKKSAKTTIKCPKKYPVCSTWYLIGWW